MEVAEECNVDGITAWKQMSGLLCNRRIPPTVKGNFRKMVIQQALLYDILM